MSRISGCAVLLCAAGVSGLATAGTLPQGTYRLHNHPDGNQRPPLYGLRLDGLFGVSSEVYTFDFDDPRSEVRISVGATAMRIFGQAWGGEDTGGAYAADARTGLYSIDFTYTDGYRIAFPDDDRIVVGPNYSNTGSIVAPNGLGTFALGSYSGSFPFAFRLGDGDSNAGYRGFSGISGWGWLAVGGGSASEQQGFTHQDSQDWLFTVGAAVIPLPSAGGMGLAGLMLLGVRRRRA